MSTNITRSFARYIAMPAVAAGIIGGAALGMAGMANAATMADPHSGNMATPSVKAHPAPDAVPGWHGHHGVWHVENVQPGYHR